MLIEVGGRKFKLDWAHDVYRTAADEWLAKYAPLLGEAARSSLREAIKMVPVRKRRGRTTCVIEEVDGDIRIETFTECSRSDQYRKEKGRVESLELAAAELAPLLSEYQMEHKAIRAEVFKQYEGRKNGHA